MTASRSLRAASFVSLSFLAFVLGLAALGRVPWFLLGLDVLLSAGSFVAYGQDKAAAQQGSRRASEGSLHILALFGGWPGALVGQYAFRHKTKKQPFRTIFWGTVALNCVGLVVLVLRSAATSG